MSGVLDGIRVIELGTRHLAPQAASMLGDMGADVIKIEERKGDMFRRQQNSLGKQLVGAQGKNLQFEGHNRNKRSMALDLTAKEGQEIVHKLVEKSDVFLTNVRLPTLKKLAVDYETLKKHNPKLVYCRGSAYGAKGPDADRRGNDASARHRSGISLTERGDNDVPFSPHGLGDQEAAIFATMAILAGLLGKERLGIGQEINVSLLGSLMSLQTQNINRVVLLGGEVKVTDRKKPRSALYNFYQASDKRWLWIGITMDPDREWPILCNALGRDDLKKDARFCELSARTKNAELLVAIMDDVIGKQPLDYWLKALGRYNLLGGSISTLADAIEDPQVIQNNYVVEYDHEALGKIKYSMTPIDFSETPVKMKSPAPELGQHTEEVLLDLGYTWEQIAGLTEKGIIGIQTE